MNSMFHSWVSPGSTSRRTMRMKAPLVPLSAANASKKYGSSLSMLLLVENSTPSGMDANSVMVIHPGRSAAPFTFLSGRGEREPIGSGGPMGGAGW